MERVFSLNQYGADATGANVSDAAWNSAVTNALNAVQAHGGAMITCGPGQYYFTPGAAVIPDLRIGFVPEGPGAVSLNTRGSSGYILTATASGNEPGGTIAAPIGGFTLRGWDATGNGVGGLSINSRSYESFGSIAATGIPADAFYIDSPAGGGIEGGSATSLVAENCTTAYHFAGGSFDYTFWNLHTVANGTALKVDGGAHCFGGTIALHGNVGASAFPSSALLRIGASATDTSWLSSCHLHFVAEADAGSTTIQDFVIQGAAGDSGIFDCYGTLSLLDSSGTWSAGSLTGSEFSFYGPIKGSPLIDGITSGVKTELGNRIVAYTSV